MNSDQASPDGGPDPATLPSESSGLPLNLEIDEQAAPDRGAGSSVEEPWTRYGVERVIEVQPSLAVVSRQADAIAHQLQSCDILVVIGRDCGGPVRETVSAAAFKRRTDAASDIFTLRLDEVIFDDEEIQRPQKIQDFDEILRVLPSNILPVNSVARSVLCVELSMDEPPGFIRTLLSSANSIAEFKQLLADGQQIIFTIDLKAQERLPSAALGNRKDVVVLDWVEPLLAYYNEHWDFGNASISKAVSDLTNTIRGRPEREAALYSAIFALKGEVFPKGSVDFEERIETAIAESEQTGEAIAQLGRFFSSGNKIEQTILALAAFGPTMSHRTFGLLGAHFLPDESIPLSFLPEQAARIVEEGGADKVRPTWRQAWRANLDFYRNKLKVAKSRTQELELRVNRDHLREHLLHVYPAGLESILEAIPIVLRTHIIDRDVEEGAIRLLVRIAVSDPKSYDRAWYVKSILDLRLPPADASSERKSSLRMLAALRALDEQTALERPGFAGSVFEDLVRALRKQDFSAAMIADLCKRLDADRFRTQPVLEGLLHNSKFADFHEVLDSLGLTQGRLTPGQRLSLMSSFVRALLPVGEYRSGAADHAARRALWLWSACLRAERFALSVPYQRIFMHRTLAREFFLSNTESRNRLLQGVLAFDPRALIFAGRSKRDMRRWLELISSVTLRGLDGEATHFILQYEDDLLHQVSECLLKTIYGPRRVSTAGLSAFDELEPAELWRDAYAELEAPAPDKFVAGLAERLLQLPLVARSALIAEWVFEIIYGSHTLPKHTIEGLVDDAMKSVRTAIGSADGMAQISDHLGFLAGIIAQVARWVAHEHQRDDIARMYWEKESLLARLSSQLQSAD